MTPTELALGWVFGVEPGHSTKAGHPRKTRGTPRAALERDFLSLLANPAGLFVAFSGGRDSSLLLAAGVSTARRHGTAPPIPVTVDFGDEAHSEDEHWQRAIVAHLGLRDWIKVAPPPDSGLIGRTAMIHLRRHGVCWPPGMVATMPTILQAVPAASTLITGEGGDEILGQRRVTPLTALLLRRRFRRDVMAAAARTMLPRRARRELLRRDLVRDGFVPDWLRPEAEATFVARYTSETVNEPLRHDGATDYFLRRAALRTGLRHMKLMGFEHGVDVHFPLVAPDFVSALKSTASRWGWLTRTEMMYQLAEDLLPRAILERESKARFNDSMFGPRAREIAQAWDGQGVDTRLIDPAALRRQWSSPTPHGLSAALLQHIALRVDASEGGA